MKNLKFGSMILLFSISFFLFSCGGSETDQNQEDGTNTETSMEEGAATDKTGKEYTSAYVCPMHCKGSGSDMAGTCPVCGMEYIARAELEAVSGEEESESESEGEHDHDHDHNHDH